MDVRVDEAGQQGAPASGYKVCTGWYRKTGVAHLRDDAVAHDDTPMLGDALAVEQADVAHDEGALRQHCHVRREQIGWFPHRERWGGSTDGVDPSIFRDKDGRKLL